MMTTNEPRRLHEHLEERRDPIGVVTLRIDREDALGALSRSLLTTLEAYLRELAAEADAPPAGGGTPARVVVLTGTGKGFIAGADIGEYDGVSQADFDDYQRLGRRVFDALEALPQFTIAAVNGYALGGGFEVALCCDVILASERAKFGLPEIKLGLLPGGGGTQRLARAVGTRYTKLLVSTGRIVSAADLHNRGLLVGTYPPNELLPNALQLAEELATVAPLPLRAAKRVVDDGVGLPLADALTLEQGVLSELFASADAKEGVAAFVAKRPPTFTGN